MRDSDPPPPEPTPWDRVGTFLSDMASVTTTIADRNMRLWMTSAPSVADGYRPDRWQADLTRWMEISAANAREVWSLWLGVAPRERFAYPLPTAYLEFGGRVDDSGVTQWTLAEQVLLPVGWAAVEQLPDIASIEITGSDPAGAAALRACLRARLVSWGLAYQLESYDVRGLWPGEYSGVVYADSPARAPIAELRIGVRGPAAAPTVPTVVLRWGVATPVPVPGEPEPIARWLPPGPVVLRPPAGGPAPPQPAFVALTGPDGAELARSFTVTPDPSGQAYLLHAARPPAGVEGSYTGSVYGISPQPRALANLAVVIEPPAGGPSGPGD
ncbi:MAG: hypothetical protein QOJ85_998 [Solirubrobacteraceae bacterium]|nr:hypothetical protein [Solirubrobacteraceae bacterium]